MSIHVKLIDCTNGEEPCLLGHSAEDLLRALPELPAPPAARPQSPLVGKPIDQATLRDALGWLDPDCPRPEWIKIIAGIHAAPIPDDPDECKRRDIAHEWSCGELDRLRRYDGREPGRYKGPEAVDSDFDTLPPKAGGVTVGTILDAAQRAGWTGSASGQSAQQIFAPCFSGIASAHPRTSDSETRTRKFRLLFPSDMRSLPEPRYVVDPIIPDCAVTLIYGPPGSCKSFLVLDLLASGATGRRALGKFPTVQGDTVLCAGEAPHGTALKRWPAWCQARGLVNYDDARFTIVPAVPLVSNANEIEALMQEIEAAAVNPRIVALDTVARAIAGQEESDARTAGLMTAAAERIRDRFHCAVVLVHHSGKDKEKGARGSSAFEANADAVFEVSRDKERGVVSLKCTKMKDADELEPIHFKEARQGDSIVLNWIPKDEHASLTRKNAGPSRTDVGAALHRLGSDVATRPLALELAGPDPSEYQVEAMVKRLQREAKGLFEGFVVHHGTGGRDGTVWGLRTGECKEGNR